MRIERIEASIAELEESLATHQMTNRRGEVVEMDGDDMVTAGIK